MKLRGWRPLLLLVIALFTVLPLAGAENKDVADMDREPLKITLIGGSPGDIWLMVSNGIAFCILKSHPGSNMRKYYREIGVLNKDE